MLLRKSVQWVDKKRDWSAKLLTVQLLREDGKEDVFFIEKHKVTNLENNNKMHNFQTTKILKKEGQKGGRDEGEGGKETGKEIRTH